MPSAQGYSAITQGLSNVAQYQREQPIREARLAEAKYRQQRSEQELQEYLQGSGARETMRDLEVAKMKNELFQLQTKSLQDATYSAFRSYNADQDPRHLNTFLKRAKETPVGLNNWGEWARFDQLSDTPHSRNLLAQAGVTGEAADEYIKGARDPEMPAYVLATTNQGEQVLMDIDTLEQATGYTRYMEQQELQDMTTRARIKQLTGGVRSADTEAIQRLLEDERLVNPDMSYKDAMQMYFDAKNSQRRTGSTIERLADEYQQSDPELSRTGALQKAKLTLESRSGAAKDIDTTAAVRDRLHALNPDKEGSFYDLDLSDPKIRSRAGELITDLEQATDKRLSNDEKRTARQLRSLLDLGNTAGQELTEDETGIIDNMFHRVKKYFSDNVEGLEGTTAYHSFRNVMRNALMGATLTKAELKAFDEASGTLGQQLGPVLEALKTSMKDVRNQLRSMANDMDPMMAKYYLGSDVEQAERAIDAFDERIRYINDLQERSDIVDDMSVKDIRTATPKVQVNIPSGITPDGTEPTMSIEDFWNKGS